MKPILFNTEMVRAILDGRKSVTRRVVKFLPGWNPKWTGYEPDGSVLYGSNNIPAAKAPYRQGDILYVRETWDNKPVSPGGHFRPSGVYYYKADGDLRPQAWGGNWHPSIHMPKEAARLFLRVTDVRVERLQDASPDDIANEGLSIDDVIHKPWIWHDLWDSTIKKADLPLYGWAANPWVWVIEFERINREEALNWQ